MSIASSSTAATTLRSSIFPIRSVLTPFDKGRKAGVLNDPFMEAYWSDEYHEIKYQIGGGCLIDQILGQWHADIAGLGDLLAPENVRSALKSVFKETTGRLSVITLIRAVFTPTRTRPDSSTVPGLTERPSRQCRLPMPRKYGRGWNT